MVEARIGGSVARHPYLQPDDSAYFELAFYRPGLYRLNASLDGPAGTSP